MVAAQRDAILWMTPFSNYFLLVRTWKKWIFWSKSKRSHPEEDIQRGCIVWSEVEKNRAGKFFSPRRWAPTSQIKLKTGQRCPHKTQTPNTRPHHLEKKNISYPANQNSTSIKMKVKSRTQAVRGTKKYEWSARWIVSLSNKCYVSPHYSLLLATSEEF